MFDPGSIIAGKYRIKHKLGEGAMGQVLAVEHVEMGWLRAIKLMTQAAAATPDAMERLRREARAMSEIESAHAVTVYDFGRLEDGSPYIVMEYLEGCDLDAYLKQQGPLPVHEAVSYVLQALEAIAEAHQKGIVHRDLKLKNLFRTADASGRPVVKVLDFGISKLLHLGASNAVTHQGVMLGTPYYMSPEQWSAAPDVDGRADIWSLGAILYRLTTGSLPFSASIQAQLCRQVLMDPPAPMQSPYGPLPYGFEAVVHRCLEKAPGARYPSAAQLAQALVPFTADLASDATTPLPSSHTAPSYVAACVAPDPTTTASTENRLSLASPPHAATGSGGAKHSWVWAVAAFAVVSVTGVALLFWSGSVRRDSSATPTASPTAESAALPVGVASRPQRSANEPDSDEASAPDEPSALDVAGLDGGVAAEDATAASGGSGGDKPAPHSAPSKAAAPGGPRADPYGDWSRH